MVRWIVADDCAKYSAEFPVLEQEEAAAFGRTSTQMDGETELQYNSEQGLLALMYGKDGVEATPVSLIQQGEISKRNAYMYYVSFQFEK